MGTTRIIDAARCNGKPFVLLTGIGFEAEMVDRADRELKNRLGVFAYLFEGVQQFHEQTAFEAVIDINGELTEVQTGTITVANAAPATSVLAQGFGQVIVEMASRYHYHTPKTHLQELNALTSLFASALVNTPTQREDIIRLRTEKVKIMTEPAQKVVIEGEIIIPEVVEFKCLLKALTILAPLASQRTASTNDPSETA